MIKDSDMHRIHRTLPRNEHIYIEDFDTQLRPLQEVVAYDTYFVDAQYGPDPYWDEDLYDHNRMEYKDNHNKPND